MVINGITVTVGPNLHAALQILRLPDKPRSLWVDELCIDQSSGEKRQQILMMHRIYATAQRVLVWLGEASEDSDLAMESFPLLVTYLETRANGDFDLNRELDVYYKAAEKHWIFKSESPQQKALQHLLRRSWFRRMWTLQEAALASPESIVVCGSRQFPYSSLQKFFSHSASDAGGLWTFAQSALETRDPNIGGAPAYLHTRIANSLRNPLSEGPQESVAVRVLDTSRRVECTEAGDRVWAIARFLPDALIARLERITEHDPARLYTELAIVEVEEGRGESVLAAAGISQQVSIMGKAHIELCSWVPDWNRYNGCTGLTRMKNTQQARHRKTLYQAAGTSSASMRVIKCNDRPTLQVRGKLLGTISDALDPYVYPPEIDGLQGEALDQAKLTKCDTLEDYLNKSLKLATSCESGPYGANTATACYHTLTASYLTGDDREYAERQVPQPTDDEIVHRFNEFTTMINYMRSSVMVKRTPPHDSHHLPLEEWPSESIIWAKEFLEARSRYVMMRIRGDGREMQAIEKMNMTCRGRRYFVTDDFYMGLAPALAAKGDRLCLFSGCCTPYVVRPVRGGKYILIGECYMHGVMQAELLRGSEVEKFFDSDLILV